MAAQGPSGLRFRRRGTSRRAGGSRIPWCRTRISSAAFAARWPGRPPRQRQLPRAQEQIDGKPISSRHSLCSRAAAHVLFSTFRETKFWSEVEQTTKSYHNASKREARPARFWPDGNKLRKNFSFGRMIRKY